MIILFFGLFVANSYYIHINHRIKTALDARLLRYALQVSLAIEVVLGLAIVAIPLTCWCLINQLQLSVHLPWLVAAYWLCAVVTVAWILLVVIKVINLRRLALRAINHQVHFCYYRIFVCLMIVILLCLLATLHDAVFQQTLFNSQTFSLSVADIYNWVKVVHVVSACVLFGTGIGTACFMLVANIKGRIDIIAKATRQVVVADWLFTGSSGVVQIVTGLLMVYLRHYSFGQLWVIGSLLGYAIAGLCWLPVVVIQIRCRDLAAQACAQGSKLPKRYYRLLMSWCALGIPAFLSLLTVIYFMSEKPNW